MEETKLLGKLKKDVLEGFCTVLGLSVAKDSTKKVLIETILEEVEDLNTFMEASKNVKADMKAMGNTGAIEAGKNFIGLHPITKERMYL